MQKTTKTSPEENLTALLLISGGIDSPVAGKMLLDKDYKLSAIHFSQEPFTDDTPKKKALLLARALGLEELSVVDAGELFKEIADKTYREYYFVLIKRFMVKVAEKIAKGRGINFLITGESLGQVSSQTMSNLNTINSATKMEILRPLLFMNKQEIIDISIKENYFETSKGPEMCDALASGRPKTKTTLNNLHTEEEKCNMKELAEKALGKVRTEKTNQKIGLDKQVIGTCTPNKLV